MAAPSVASLRMVHLVPVLWVGGLERVATTLVLAVSERGARVVVASHGGEPFEPVLHAAAIPFVRIPRPRMEARLFPSATLSFARLLRRERPDVVHAHNPIAATTAGLARLISYSRRTRIVSTYHGLVNPDGVKRAARALALSADIVVGVSPAATRQLVDAGFPPERIETIFNAVEAKATRSREEVLAEFGWDADTELVVTVGRYAPEKNHRLLLEAVARLAPHRPRLRALVVGLGSLDGELRAAVTELGLDGRAVVTGVRRDAVDLTAAADVFALPSRNEALPLVVLEAMELGTPIVATSVGGIPDVVEDGERGLLVPAGDAEAMAAALARVLDDRALSERLVDNARVFVHENCSPKAMVDAYCDVYMRVVNRHRRVRG